MKRGDVYLADLMPRSGSEQKGKRPVIIVSHDSFNTKLNWRSIIIVPISTSKRQMKRGPTVVDLPTGVGGLRSNSVAICHQVTTLDRSKLQHRFGSLPQTFLDQVEQALKNALDFS